MNRSKLNAGLVTLVGTASVLAAGWMMASFAGGGTVARTGGDSAGEPAPADLPAAVTDRAAGEVLEWEREEGQYEVTCRDERGRARAALAPRPRRVRPRRR